MFSFLELEFWLYKFFSFVYHNLNLVILISICLISIFLIPSKERLRFKKFKKNLFFSLIIFIFLLISFEMILNIGGYFYFNIYSNLENPNIGGDAFRILFLGESTTAGGGIGSENAYPAQVEQILQQRYQNRKIRSYNRGIGAIETTAILRNMDRNMVRYKPHLVVLMAGSNDCFVSDEDVPKLKKWYLKFKLYRLIALIRDFHKIATDINRTKFIEGGDFRYIGGPLYTYHYSPFNPLSQVIYNLDFVTKKVHSYNSEVWFAGYLQPDAREKVNPVLKEVAEKNNITYIEDYPEVDFKINRSLFADDGWHPSKEGHAIIAKEIAERIVKESMIDKWADEAQRD